MVKRLARVFPLVGVCLTAGCLERATNRQADETGVIYHHHFVGQGEMGRTTNAANLKAVLNLAASKELRDQLLQKLSKAPREFWQKEIPANVPDGAEFFRPLLEDMFSAESYLEVRGPAKRPESVLAVKLDGQRAQLWSTNLWKLLLAWKLGAPTGLTTPGQAGWEYKGKPALVRFVRSGEWVLIGLGGENLAVLPGVIEKVGKTGRPVPMPTDSWFELEIDWPQLSHWFPLMAKYKLPPTHLSIIPRGEYLRTEARLRYSDSIPWKYEPWKIPTNSISDPIISLTVARGIAPLLAQLGAIRDLELEDLPNQFCLWGQSRNIVASYLTVPVTDATNLTTQLALRVPKVVHSYLTNHTGTFTWVTNKAEMIWQGVPFIQLRMRPLRDGGQEYLLAETFPPGPEKRIPPAELFTQFMGRTNLVYYDWEITGERLLHAIQLHQFYDLANNFRFEDANVPTQKWLQAVRPHSGNTATEITLVGSKELLLVRRSHLGFSGFELASLTRWIESEGFPLRYERPPPLLPGRRATSPIRTNVPPRGK